MTGCAGQSGAGDDASSAGPQDPCVPGQSLGCTCEGGVPGAQICEPDGVGYSECVCNDDGASEGSPSDDSPSDDGPGDDGPSDDGPNGDGPSDDGPGDDGPSDDGPSDDGPTEPGDDDASDGDAVPSWTNDIVPLLATSCGAGVGGCHDRTAYNAEIDKGCLNWVSFEDVLLGAVFNSGENVGQPTGCPDLPLYERVVDRSPWQCGAFFNAPTAILIKPYDPEGSYVIQKINGITCDNGLQMPPPESKIEISQAQIDMLTEWIAAGAPYDG